MSRRTKKEERERAEALKYLRRVLRPGSKVYTVLRHVSRSGMSRRIDLYTIRDNRPMYLSGYVSKVLGYKRHKDQGLVVGGCGMDMGYHLVNSLSYALHGMEAKGDGKTKVNRMGLEQFKIRPGHYRAGYSLDHDWI